MTWSPVSKWGAKIGLCLPRSRRATSVARRPRTMPSASTTCQERVMSRGVGENVRTERTSVVRSATDHLLEREAVGRGRLAGGAAVPGGQDPLDLAGPAPAPAHVDEGADDGAHHLVAEGGGGDVEAQEALSLVAPPGVEHPAHQGD